MFLKQRSKRICIFPLLPCMIYLNYSKHLEQRNLSQAETLYQTWSFVNSWYFKKKRKKKGITFGKIRQISKQRDTFTNATLNFILKNRSLMLTYVINMASGQECIRTGLVCPQSWWNPDEECVKNRKYDNDTLYFCTTMEVCRKNETKIISKTLNTRLPNILRRNGNSRKW